MDEKEAKLNIPVIKKKISSYLSSEDGKITKEALLTVGAFVTSAAASAALLSKSVAAQHTNIATPTHDNSIYSDYNSQLEVAKGGHTHHGSSTHSNVHSSY